MEIVIRVGFTYTRANVVVVWLQTEDVCVVLGKTEGEDGLVTSTRQFTLFTRQSGEVR